MAGIRFRLGRKRLTGSTDRYTLLILPDRRRRFRKLHVSRRFVVFAAIVAGALLTAGLISPHLWMRVQTQRTTLERLASENERLRGQTARFEASVDDLQRRLSGIETAAGELANELGMEMQSVAAGGAGGMTLAGRSPLLSELDALSGRTAGVRESLEQLDDAFRVRSRLISATPSIMPAQGWFSHGFGWRKDPFSNKRRFHRGIDIVNHRGTPVYATADGVVSRAVRIADLGKTVDISHGRGYVTRFAHLSEILVKPGQKIERGGLIGKMGSTGRSTGDHLHYEVWHDGRRVNPWKYLGQRGG
ncbi:MAG: peptidoglycan DD-metalloendopeptidase family protein [Acidobacteriota bacterium]